MATPKEIAEITYKAYQAGDVDTIMKHLAPAVDWELVGPQSHMRYAGPRTSHADIRQVFAHMAADDDIQRFEPIEYIEAGDKLVVLGIVKGTARATGKAYETQWAPVFTYKDDKITRWRGFYDTAARCL